MTLDRISLWHDMQRPRTDLYNIGRIVDLDGQPRKLLKVPETELSKHGLSGDLTGYCVVASKGDDVKISNEVAAKQTDKNTRNLIIDYLTGTP